MVLQNIKDILDEYSAKINTKEFIATDPIQFAHRYSRLQDMEVAAILSAINAWGRRDIILKDVEKMLKIMGTSPYDFVMNSKLEKLTGDKAIHRTFNMGDFGYICRGLRGLYNKHSSLEECFTGKDMFDGIKYFRSVIINANTSGHRCTKHLSNPESNSACKRMHLFLKWMVRNDGIVDLGMWKNISPGLLYIPLDVHVGRVSRKLGLLSCKQNDKKAVIELTSVLRKFNPQDPVLYDFGLFGIGEQKIDIEN